MHFSKSRQGSKSAVTMLPVSIESTQLLFLLIQSFLGMKQNISKQRDIASRHSEITGILLPLSMKSVKISLRRKLQESRKVADISMQVLMTKQIHVHACLPGSTGNLINIILQAQLGVLFILLFLNPKIARKSLVRHKKDKAL